MNRKKSALAQNIILLRKQKGWNQVDLAEAADLSVSFIKKIETDETEGSSVTREKIARALGVTKDELHAKLATQAKDLPPMSASEAAKHYGPKLSDLSHPERIAAPTALYTKDDIRTIAVDLAKEVASELAAEVSRLKAENEDLRRRLAAFETEAPPLDLDPLALMTEAEADAELSRLESEVLGSLGKPKQDKA